MLNKGILRTALLALVVLLVQVTWALAGTTGNIDGHVTDQNGNPLAGARVTAASPSQSGGATTGSNGFYSILNLSPDHLDRYHSMVEYAEAKFRIFANQGPDDTFVGNLDDPIVASAPGEDGNRIKTRALWFSAEPHRKSALYLRNNELIVFAPPTGDPRPVSVMPVSEIPLRGAHNVENVMGAVLVALAAGLPVEAIRAGVRSFRALGHRLEPVAEIDGVAYVDDSKATNPGSVIAALRSFDRPIVLIAGGKAKGTDFSEMGKVVSSRAKAVVLIGDAADEIAGVIKRAKVARAASMDEAVSRARKLATSGDVVLLSPGCASFDMFRSAEQRGELFVEAVRALQPVVHAG